MDAVFIGASPTFTSWVAPMAWGKYGITMRTFGNNSQPFEAVESFLRLARNTQPDAVFLIAINGVYSGGLSVKELHATTDYFPTSVEKLKLIHSFKDVFHIQPMEELELLFPIVRYHSRWNSLSASSFHRVFEGYKGGFVDSRLFEISKDISVAYHPTTERLALSNETMDVFTCLLEYCRDEHVKVVFVLSAQYRTETTNKWFNTMMDLIRDFGFPLIDEMEDFAVIGLNDETDFYNTDHTNIHGALKITDYLSQYLIKNYGFEDKRGDPAYASWNEAYEQYSEIVRPYLKDEELCWLE